jgi:hypothetical protein
MASNLFPNIKQAMDKFKASPFHKSEPKPVNRHQPASVVVWRTWLDRDRWLFMANSGKLIQEWRQAHFNLHGSWPDHITSPNTVELSDKGSLNDMQLIDLGADKRETCKICHGQGVAYILRGLLILNDIPQKLKSISCRCQPTNYKPGQKQTEADPWE